MSGQDEDGVELDFESDQIIQEAEALDRERNRKRSKPNPKTTSTTSTSSNRPSNPSNTTASRIERERLARQQGLSRNLLESLKSELSQDSQNRVLDKDESSEIEPIERGGGEQQQLSVAEKMMLKMYRSANQNQSASSSSNSNLKRPISDTEIDDSSIDKPEQKKSQLSTSSNTSTSAPSKPDFLASEPLQIDSRWIGGASVRHGIGSISVSKAIKEASTPEAKEERERKAKALLEDFRGRTAAEHRLKHTEALLKRARKTCEELDRGAGLEYDTLWLEPSWLSVSSERLPQDIKYLVSYAFSLDSTEDHPSKGLEQEAGVFEREDSPRDTRDESTGASRKDTDHLKEERSDSEHSIKEARREEAKQFCSLDASTRLKFTLAHLRSAYFYCLFCGCRYDSESELNSLCPGEEEEDHD